MSNRTVLGIASLVVFAVFAGCSQSPSESPGPAASPSIVGTWEMVTKNGKPISGSMEQISLEFGDTEVVIGTDGDTLKGTYTIDTSEVPNRITIRIEEQEEPAIGIWKLTDDSLIIKAHEKGMDFAKDFEVEEGYVLMEFRRKQ